MNKITAESSYLKWRSRFVLKLALFHFMLVIIFDLLGAFAPGLMTSAVMEGSDFSIGIVFGVCIVLSVMVTAVIYSYRINKKELELSKESGPDDE